MQSSIDKIPYRIFIFLLIFSPLAFGTVSTWSLTIMEALSIGAVLLLFISCGLNDRPIYKAPGTLLIMLYPAYILVQLIPLPAETVKLISPATYSLYKETIGIVDPVQWVSLSINKKATLEELFRYISYAGFYLLTVQLLSHRSLLKKTVNYLAIFAAILSVTAILQRFTSPGKIYWFYKTPSAFFGPYFNLQIGANGLYMFFLAGLAVSASHTRLRHGLGNTLLKPMAPRAKKTFVSGAVCMLLLIPLVILFNIGTIKGESLLFSALKLSATENLSENDTEKILKIEQKALKFNPLDFLGHWFAAQSAIRISDNEAALRYFKKAMHRNPVSGTLLQDFGEFMSETGKHDIAEKLILAGIKYNRISSVRYKTYAEWLLANNHKDRGIDTMRTAISMNIKKSRSYIDLMDEKGLSLDDIRNAIPDRVEPNIFLAEFLLDKGMQREAESTYLKAFNYLDNEEEVNPGCFFKANRYFIKQKQYDEALNIMLKGIEYLPDNAKIRVAAASLYERIGILYRAIEEYKNALILDPKNRHVRKKLKELTAT